MRQKRSLKGSYTVEAAFLIPLGIGVILFLIFSALILHDRVAACAWTHEAAVWEGFQKENGNQDFSAEVLVTKTKEQVTQDESTIMVSCIGAGQALPVFVRNLFRLGKVEVEKFEQVKQIYGEQMVRLRGFVEGVYTNGSNVQEGTGT